LFLIQQTQEAEQAYEEKSHEFIKIKKKYENELNALEGALTEVNDRITKNTGETDNDDFESDEKLIVKNIRIKVKEVYKGILANEGKGADSNNSTLYLLGELEKKCDGLIKDEKDYREKDIPIIDNVAQPSTNLTENTSKQIQKEIKVQNMDKKKKQNNDANIEKLKAGDKTKKSKFDIYKPMMKRSKPKAIQKKVEDDNKLSKDDLNKLYYLGFY
jgi:hypothetical protein